MALVILVVEDNEMNRDMLVRRLERRHYTIRVAADGQAALDSVKTEPPDLILMNMRMPIMDGWTAIAELKKDPRTASIPIIALSANAFQEDQQHALLMGCLAYETKPINFARLLQIIQTLEKQSA